MPPEPAQDGPRDGFWGSPFNSDVRAAVPPGRQVRIADCTLRDGEQQAGVVLTPEARLRLAHGLDELGVYEIEAGTPASSEQDAAAIKDHLRGRPGGQDQCAVPRAAP